MADRASYIKISGNGANALDFHIAYYVGHLAAKEPEAYFHIISKDTGFDPLIAHLKSLKIFASRSVDIADIPSIQARPASTDDQKITVVLKKLNQQGASRPRTVRTLSSTINALFQKSLEPDDIAFIINMLIKQGAVTVTDTKVTYPAAE